MQRFLIALSLGPVQSLIGAARRSRDLWCGSWLLSEAARAAAALLHERQPGCLVFPCLENPDADLRPQNRTGDAANIANVLRAEVALPDATAVRVLCADAKAAAAKRLTALGRSALDRLGTPVREDVWRAQIDDILEGFAVWVSEAGDEDYPAAGERLGRALAARKATRDFRPCAPLAQGLPKSSLDGALETVLPNWSANHAARRKLALAGGEQLDALGVIKRLAGDVDQFTAYPRIAADPWIRRLTSEQRERIVQAYEPLVSLGSVTRVRGNAGVYAALPFDGSMLFPSRLDKELSNARSAKERQALEALRDRLQQLSTENSNASDAGQRVGVPVPYAAILKADGDRMGKLLRQASSAKASRTISRALHAFASNVRQVVRSHRGHAIYSGGDDVLALVPLVSALICARALADDFAKRMTAIATDLGLAERPTLSVGLGIGHIMEPLNELRDRAERAEREAKGDDAKQPRNALAIMLGVRSGAELRWRTRWDDDEAFRALHRFAAAFRDDLLPARIAYDLRGIDQRMSWLRDENGASAQGMRGAELHRLLDRARTSGGRQRIPEDLRELVLEQASKRSLDHVADTLIVARWLSARTDGDLGERR